MPSEVRTPGDAEMPRPRQVVGGRLPSGERVPPGFAGHWVPCKGVNKRVKPSLKGVNPVNGLNNKFFRGRFSSFRGLGGGFDGF